MISSRFGTKALIVVWTGIILSGLVLDSRANSLTIAPTRVVLDGKTRVATVFLTNKGETEATYRILLKDKRMLATGQIVDIETPHRDERPAAEMVRYSPRRIVLPPGGNQTIRLMLRNPSAGQLEKGEYRTHLVFQSVPEARPTDLSEGVTAQAIIETSIPVIIRRDKPEATVAFGSAAVDTTVLPDGRRVLHLELLRGGLRSVYGDLTVEWEHDGEWQPLARLNGLGVYHPTPLRRLAVPLNVGADVEMNHGRLAVRFAETDLGRGDLVAETIVDLTPGVIDE